ncbi:MAG: hypothetical protein NC548_48295 [Lachnospiraceae bacterium]|nr:hypothetical protein [Lachnospiraceae bacterium]MCM1474989.1 hypothetical protein [Muribaculaceae bacterium]
MKLNIKKFTNGNLSKDIILAMESADLFADILNKQIETHINEVIASGQPYEITPDGFISETFQVNMGYGRIEFTIEGNTTQYILHPVQRESCQMMMAA